MVGHDEQTNELPAKDSSSTVMTTSLNFNLDLDLDTDSDSDLNLDFVVKTGDTYSTFLGIFSDNDENQW